MESLTGSKVVYFCPLCTWEYEEPKPQVLAVDARGTINETCYAAGRRLFAEIEGALHGHLVEAHTAPIVLRQA